MQIGTKILSVSARHEFVPLVLQSRRIFFWGGDSNFILWGEFPLERLTLTNQVVRRTEVLSGVQGHSPRGGVGDEVPQKVKLFAHLHTF